MEYTIGFNWGRVTQSASSLQYTIGFNWDRVTHSAFSLQYKIGFNYGRVTHPAFSLQYTIGLKGVGSQTGPSPMSEFKKIMKHCDLKTWM